MEGIDILGLAKEGGALVVVLLWSIHLFRRDGSLKSSLESIASSLTKLDTKLDAEVKENLLMRSAMPQLVHAQALLMKQVQDIQERTGETQDLVEQMHGVMVDIRKAQPMEQETPTMVTRLAEMEAKMREVTQRRSYYPPSQVVTPTEPMTWDKTAAQTPQALARNRERGR